jgi:hypothetical protein
MSATLGVKDLAENALLFPKVGRYRALLPPPVVQVCNGCHRAQTHVHPLFIVYLTG